MKSIVKIILIVPFILFFGNQLLKSQPFEQIVDTTKKWNVLKGDFSPNGDFFSTTTVLFQSDTTINNLVYKKIFSSYDTINFNFNGELIREDSIGRVFTKEWNSPEQLIYDFSVNVGDTIVLHNFMGGITEAKIDSIDTIFLAGKNRKRIFNSFYNFGNVVDCWIEGIGSLMGVLYSGNVIIDFGTNLLCYWQNGSKLLSTEYSDLYGCYYTNVEIDEINSLNRIKVYPNITRQYLTIENNQDENLIFKIYNSIGQEIINTLIESKIQIINISDVRNGLYFYQIINKKKEIIYLNGKIIKE